MGQHLRSTLFCLLLTHLGTATLPCLAGSSKRGFAGGGIDNVLATNAGWFYDWGLKKPAGDYDAKFVPMFWSGGSVNTANIEKIINYGDTTHVLGFNEPERTSQANMSVSAAIAKWQTLQAEISGTGIKLVSPAVSDDAAGRQWLANFMSQANLLGLQVDAVAFHWYGVNNPNNPVAAANQLLGRVDAYHNAYGKPVWLTEFAIHDWGGNYTDEAVRQANHTFLDRLIPGLEARSYVEGYSFYQWFSDAMLVEGSPRTPTVVGDAYIPSIESGQTLDLRGKDQGDDRIYLKGGAVVNTGMPAFAAIRHVDAIAGTSTLGGNADWGIAGPGSFSVRTGAVLRKSGTNQVSISGMTIANDGMVEFANGSTRLDGGTTFAGFGKLGLEPDAMVALGSPGDLAGVTLSQPIDLRGGVISSGIIRSGVHRMDNVVTVHATSTFSGDGILVVNGPLLAPVGGVGGGIVKAGPGTLRINADNSFRGTTSVIEGTLLLGASGFLSHSPVIEVKSAGSWDVSSHARGYLLDNQALVLQGQVLGSLHMLNDSTVAPTSSASVIAGDVTVSEGLVLIGGVGFNEVNTPGGSGLAVPTAMNIEGNYTQQAAGALAVDLLNPQSHDALRVGGAASLDGVLEVGRISEFAPQFGDSFVVLTAGGGVTGRFHSVLTPSLPAGQVFVIDYGSHDVTLRIAGSVADFDYDGDVDAEDFSLWQVSFGQDDRGDANGDELADGRDFLAWQREFTGPVTAVIEASKVPEPAPLANLLIAVVAHVLRWRSDAAKSHSQQLRGREQA
jgi:autotransporter-associated beta strand protein